MPQGHTQPPPSVLGARLQMRLTEPAGPALLCVDGKGRIVHATSSMAKNLGRTVQELQVGGRTVQELQVGGWVCGGEGRTVQELQVCVGVWGGAGRLQ